MRVIWTNLIKNKVFNIGNVLKLFMKHFTYFKMPDEWSFECVSYFNLVVPKQINISNVFFIVSLLVYI